MKMAEKEAVELISLHESKIHLHVEKFSLKTNWKQAEGLWYNQDCNTDICVIG